ncbi:MAG: class I SAM-dependent methyltransferase [Pseudoxanthomonas sp.]
MSKLITQMTPTELGTALPDHEGRITALEEIQPGRSATEVGLYDRVLSGWYQADTNELFTGITIGPEDVVLDLGCGDGGSLLFCARRGAAVIGIDIDSDAVEAMKARLEGTPAKSMQFHVGGADPLPLKDESVTRVICTEVLEHVDDPAAVMKELVRVGKPGARYLITVPDALQETLQKEVAPDVYFQKPNHIRIFEREQFAQLVSDAGLVVEHQAFFGFYWSIWFAMFWSCGVDFSDPRHPILDNWAKTWRAVLDSENGPALKKKLDAFMPKSHAIVASKPITTVDGNPEGGQA